MKRIGLDKMVENTAVTAGVNQETTRTEFQRLLTITMQRKVMHKK